jgi:hypothetical protein
MELDLVDFLERLRPYCSNGKGKHEFAVDFFISATDINEDQITNKSNSISKIISRDREMTSTLASFFLTNINKKFIEKLDPMPTNNAIEGLSKSFEDIFGKTTNKEMCDKLGEFYFELLEKIAKSDITTSKAKFSNTSIANGFKNVFFEIPNTNKLKIKKPNEIKLFHFNVENSAFSFCTLHEYIAKNIGRYVFSRVRRDELIGDEQNDNICNKAVALLKRAGAFDNDKICEELGDIVLYVLLEQDLKAPKIYNKIELVGTQTVNQGGLHLLTLNSEKTFFQIVIAKSNIVDNLQTAIDNAFNLIIKASKETEKEYKLLETSILSQSFDTTTAEYLKSIILPKKRNEKITTEMAFGIFVGYSLDLQNKTKENVKTKIATDIIAQMSYIEKKIADHNLGGYSFYFYFIPFNTATNDKKTIINTVINGGEV